MIQAQLAFKLYHLHGQFQDCFPTAKADRATVLGVLSGHFSFSYSNLCSDIYNKYNRKNVSYIAYENLRYS